MKKKIKKALWIIFAVVLFIFIVIPAATFAILKWKILTPETLTPLIVENANKMIEGKFDCEKIELTYFETFPYLGVKLSNGFLLSPKDTTDSDTQVPDTIAAFNNITIAVNPSDYFLFKQLTLNYFNIDHPRIYGYIDKNNKPNWMILKEDSTETITSADSTAFEIPNINLRRITINDGYLQYVDEVQSTFAELKDFGLLLKGAIRKDNNKFKIQAAIAELNFDSPAYTLNNSQQISFESGILLTNQYQDITLENAELKINNIPFTADGYVKTIAANKRDIDLKLGLSVSDMADLLDYIPDIYFKNKKDIKAEGKITLESSIKGMLGDSIVPTINLSCKVDDAAYHVKGIKQGIDQFLLDLKVHLNGTAPDSSFLKLENLQLKGTNAILSSKGTVHDLFNNPAVSAEIVGDINFTQLCKDFLNPDTLLVEGILKADINTTFTVKDILSAQYGNITAAGNLSFDHFKAYSKPLDLNFFISGTKLETRMFEPADTARTKMKKILNATLTVDTLNARYQKSIRTNIRNLKMQARTTPIIDTTSVMPMAVSFRFGHLSTLLPDSAWLSTKNLSVKAGIGPSRSDKRMPSAGVSFTLDTLKYFSLPLRTGLSLAKSEINVEAVTFRDLYMKYRKERQRTTTRRNTMRARNVSAKRDTAQKNPLDIWDIQGNIKFDRFRLFSKMFPLPISMDPANLKFTTNNVALNGAKVHIGKSDLKLNGNIRQIRRAFKRGGTLRGNFLLESEYIDCNQLLQAMNAGMEYATTNTPVTDIEDEALNLQTDVMETADSLATETVVDSTATEIFRIPKFLDMELDTKIKKIDFRNLKMTDVYGNIVIRNQSFNLNELSMNSNIGKGKITLLYSSQDKNEADIGFDLGLNEIQVDKLIGLFPTMDTLVPMLRSFEGVVDCQITANTKLDSAMSVKLPTLQSFCYLHGKNMTLLDGETFAEISKMLWFKNKERNVIDSISVDLAVRDNKIEVFPFLVEMDRYRVAVGGTQNLDMTFDYHISVLKSPLPFKIGVDIKGNLDDFKIRLAKCRYKDIFQPAKVAELHSSRSNIREEIREAILEQIKKSVQTPSDDS